MKILYDYQMFSIQKFGGITRYFTEIIRRLPPKHQFTIGLLFSENHHLKENRDVLYKRDILPGKSFKGKYFIQQKIAAINFAYSRYCIKKNDFDLFHPTFYDPYFLKILRKPYVITVHDLILFKSEDPFYKSHPRKLQMEEVIRKANRIISISDHTKKDIIEVFKIAPDKIDVVHHGYIKTVTGNKNNKYGRYLLFVGQRSHHKNFATFAQAAGTLLNKEEDLKLICVGRPFEPYEIALLEKLHINTQSIALKVDDRSLNDLYAGALVFVYPSLYEGFGMPILEAFANNCPVCLSNTSSFPEVAGNAGVYFDPNSADSILAAIEKVIYDKNFSKQLIEEGKNRLTLFSWEKAARETIASYEKVV